MTKKPLQNASHIKNYTLTKKRKKLYTHLLLILERLKDNIEIIYKE